MHAYLTEMLECPCCHGPLSWHVTVRHRDQIEEGSAECSECKAQYPIREGIGIFLTPDLPRNDLWEQVGSGLTTYLGEHPDVERMLLSGPVEALGPADQFFRSMVLEERGAYKEAQRVSRTALSRLHTGEYLACSEREMDYVVDRLAGGTDPIVDLASGRGGLAERLATRLDRPVVLTDFSLRVLRRDRRVFQAADLLGCVSFLGFDARRTPFRQGSVSTLTSNMGLPNMEEPGVVLTELRRIVSGEFLALTHFYPDDDVAHGALLSPDTFLYRESALRLLAAAGWEVSIANTCRGRAEPTPRGVVLEDFGIDGLPIAETMLEWCVLHAR